MLDHSGSNPKPSCPLLPLQENNATPVYAKAATITGAYESMCLTLPKPQLSCSLLSFQENNAIAVLDVKAATITGVYPLGFKNHSAPGNGLDPSDRGGEAKIGNWPVFGMYQPDEIRSFR